MKVLAIGRNYVEHIQELNNERPEAPIIFTKPDTSLITRNRPFYYPDFSNDIHHEVEILIKIQRAGKKIHERFAHKYYSELGIGIDFTARDLQATAKAKGLPWALAKGFDGSAPVSEFIPISHVKNLNHLDFHLEVDGEKRQTGNTSLMLFSFDYIVSYISHFITLKKGDIIFTGTPKGVGPVKIGNRLTAFIDQTKMLSCEIK